jgi:hypothetical protein
VTEKPEAKMHWLWWAAVGLVMVGIGVFLWRVWRYGNPFDQFMQR